VPLSVRGFHGPADLDALVLACLEKDPDRRPQSASQLLERLAACSLQSVERWDSVRAAAWWQEYQPDLDAAARQSSGDIGTFTVDVARRS